MALILRNYQEEALLAIQGKFSQGTNRQLIALPTGSGKTLLLPATAKHYNKRTLVLAHREELIQQAFDEFKFFWPEADIGICRAKINEIDHKIVIASVQTACQPKRLQQLKEIGFDILLIDEAHHAAANSYQKIIAALGFNDTRKLLVGVTATPERSDTKGLSEVFDEIVFERSISTMIKGGYLSPVRGRKISTSFSIKGVKTKAGDFIASQLSNALNHPQRNNFIVSKYKEHAHHRKAVAFCADVKHAQDLAAAFNKQNITAAAVWGAMPSEDRRKVLLDFKEGQLQVVTSCGVLTEGFDEPSISCIIMARPTKSKILYTQCVGRGLRLYPGKKDCLVLDFADNHLKIDGIVTLRSTIPIATIQIDSEIKAFDQEDRGRKTKLIAPCGTIDHEFDLFERSKFPWVTLKNGEHSLSDDQNREIIIRPLDGGYVAVFYSGSAITRLVDRPTSKGYCFGVCEDFARKNLKLNYATKSWLLSSRNSPATPAQISFLLQYGVKDTNISKAQASLYIRSLVAQSRQEQRTNQKHY